jgi:hypothetical protein
MHCQRRTVQLESGPSQPSQFPELQPCVDRQNKLPRATPSSDITQRAALQLAGQSPAIPVVLVRTEREVRLLRPVRGCRARRQCFAGARWACLRRRHCSRPRGASHRSAQHHRAQHDCLRPVALQVPKTGSTSLEKRNPWNALASLARRAQQLATPGACETVRQGRVGTRGRLMRHPLGLSYPASTVQRSR